MQMIMVIITGNDDDGVVIDIGDNGDNNDSVDGEEIDEVEPPDSDDDFGINP